MKLSQSERLILWNKYEIRKHLNPQSAEHCQNAQTVLESGYQPLYETVFERLSDDEFSQEKAKFVFDVLDMFDALQRFEQKTGAEIDDSFGKFRGFDGHGDLVGFARFNVEKLGRWNYLNIKEFDAHFPIEGTYGRMLEVWLSKPSPGRFDLTSEEVRAILAAAVHPDNRK